MREGVITIYLTRIQQEALQPLHAKLQAAYDEGRPTMLVGQVNSAMTEVQFAVLSHEEAIQVLLVTHPEHAELIAAGELPPVGM